MGYQNNLRAASTFVATVLCLLCVHVEARGTGAPISACVSMTPPHGSANAELPYELDIGAITTYSSGTEVRVTITGGAYQGFLLQARNAAGTPVGRFPSAPVNTKSISCTSADSSMTHANTVAKNGFTYTWNPPSDNQGNVYFRATVAQSSVSWKMIESSPMMPSGYPTVVADAATMADDGTDSPTGNSATTFLPEFIIIITSVLAAVRNFLW